LKSNTKKIVKRVDIFYTADIIEDKSVNKLSSNNFI